MVAFTGSAAVGAAIYKQGAQISPSRGGLRATLAEMGGKNPILVFSDADVDEAVVGILGSAFGHSNQKCSAASRILIQRSIYDRVRNRLVEGAASLRAGPADQPGVVVTPLIDEEARERVLDAGKRAATEGTIALAAEPPAPDSTLLTPLLVEIPAARAKTASTTQQEIFGPVLALVPFRDEAEAIALANDTRYALTAGVFSRSPATISRVVAALDAGNVYVNRPTTGARVGVEPFGGHKLSGTGPKAGGSDYLWAFVTARAAQKTVGRPPEGSLDAPEQEMRPWSEPPENRARALASAVALLAGDLKSQWTAATTGAKKDATDATFQLLRHLLQQIPEIELPEPTIALPGQQTSINWDTPRGCGIIVADDGGSLTGLAGMLCGALLAGNGAIVCVSGRRRAAAGLLVRALLQAGVPAESLIEAEAGVRLPSIAELPNVTFAAVDAGLALTQYIYMLLADASATGEAPLLKALLTSNDGPGIGEPGFLRRFALPKTVAIRTLHLGADLELPDTRE
jgi:acyl-CoA reductase-like NAD-dependent aldehyde dehydrogenase